MKDPQIVKMFFQYLFPLLVFLVFALFAWRVLSNAKIAAFHEKLFDGKNDSTDFLIVSKYALLLAALGVVAILAWKIGFADLKNAKDFGLNLLITLLVAAGVNAGAREIRKGAEEYSKNKFANLGQQTNKPTFTPTLPTGQTQNPPEPKPTDKKSTYPKKKLNQKK